MSDRIYLSREEATALSRSAISGPDVGVRVLDLLTDDGRVCLHPDSRDALGQYPRWAVLRLGILRNLDITSTNITEEERPELLAFAAEHGKELIG